MKFAKNRLYVEKYVKCPNCGLLIFEATPPSAGGPQNVAGRLYCSAWCVTWDAERSARSGTDEVRP